MRSHPAKNCSMLELQNVNGCIHSATAAALNHELVTKFAKEFMRLYNGIYFQAKRN